MNLQKEFNEWCKLTKRSGGVLLGSSIREFFKHVEKPEEKKETYKEIGILSKPWGVKGYIIAQQGHVVFEFKDRYIIILKHSSLPNLHVPFYKHTLLPIINLKP
jgi:hypothetical protein